MPYEDTHRSVTDDLDPAPSPEIDRVDTLVRIALTILFALIATVIRSVLAVLIVFELLWTLVTKEPPRPRVRDLANRIVAYYYRICRYLTFNESRVPFPFTDFPKAIEPPDFDPTERESEAIGIGRWDEEDEEEDRH